MSRARRLRRFAHLGLKILVGLILGVLSILVLALFSLRFEPVRAFAAAKTNALLEPSFRGRLVIQRIGRIDLRGVGGADLEVWDQNGKSVLRARGAAVSLSVLGLAYDAVFGDAAPLVVHIDRTSVENVEVTLIDDGTGSPTLVRAFEPKEPSPPSTEPGPTIQIDEIAIATTKVRGSLASPGPVDVDLFGLNSSLRNDSKATKLVVREVKVAARQLPAVHELDGRIDAEAVFPASSALSVRARFAGQVAGSATELNAKLAGEALDAKLTLVLSPESAARVAPGLALTEPANVTAAAVGSLRDLALEAAIEQSASRVAISGRLRDGAAQSTLDAKLRATHLDVSRLVSGTPASSLELEADAELRFGDSGLDGTVALTSSPESKLAGQALPKVLIEAKLAAPKDEALSVSGSLDVAEPGAGTRATFALRSGEAGLSFEASSVTEISNPPRLAALSGATASGKLELRAGFDGQRQHLDANGVVRLDAVRHPSVEVRGLDATFRAAGPASAPELTATVRIAAAKLAERTLSNVRLSAAGTADALRVRARLNSKTPELVELRAELAPRSSDWLRGAAIDVRHQGSVLKLTAAGISIAPHAIAVRRLTFEGAGHAEASFSYGRALERVELRAQRLRPARVLAVFGVTSALKEAEVDATASFSGQGQRARANLEVLARRVQLGELEGGTARIALALERGKVSGDVEAALGAGANLKVALQEVTVPFPVGARSAGRIAGKLALSGDLDLDRLKPFFPIAGIERATGRITFDAAVERPSRDELAHAQAKILSKGLMLVGHRGDTQDTKQADKAKESAPWTLRGIDFDLDAKLEKQVADLTARLFDKQGNLVELAAGLSGLNLDPNRLSAAALLTRPFTARLHVPARALERLPAPIRPIALRGALALDAEASGTLADPKLSARASLAHFGPQGERADPRGLNVSLDAEYAKHGGSVLVRADGRRRDVLSLETRWQGDLRALGAKAARSPVTGDVKLELREFPLAAIAQLNDRQIRGRLSGHAKLEGFGRDARLDLALETKKLRIERLVVDQVRARLKTDRDWLDLQASVHGSGGRAEAKVRTGFRWGTRLVPEVDERVEGSVVAEKLELAAFAPLLEGTVSELAGKLDAKIDATLEGGKGQLSGRIALHGGAAQLSALGQRFHGIEARVAITPNRVKLEELRARGSSGAFRVTGAATLDGVVPTAADAKLSIDEDEKLPITIEGEAIGDAWGTIEASYRKRADEKLNEVRIRVPKLAVELPELAPQGIQDLGEDPHIRVGFQRNDGEFVEIPLQPIETPSEPSGERTVILIELGSVSLEKGREVQVTLGGNLRAELGEKLDLVGRIDTKSGRLDISGKQFDIERGSVTFTGGAPDNPTISAVARYDSPAGYTVYAEYTGTAKAGKLRLQSDPPLAEDEILTLLLFGTPDGSFGAGGGDSLSAAVGVAGGTAAQGLNRALGRVTDLDVSARIDTSTGAPRPELVVQLTPRVAARVTQALGEPAPGQSSDRTFVTLEFRLARAWSLSTMVGDRGASAVDLIWRKRY